MRQFKLINAVGVEWDMMQPDGFFYLPQGLGYSRTISTIRAGADYLISDEFLNQKSPYGEMVFRTYVQFQNFVSFVTNDDPLYLYYNPAGTTWYRIRCKVSSLSKSEMSQPGILRCPITFSCLGTWSELVTVTQSEMETGVGKIYTYTYPYTYADTTIATALISNGALESPLRLNIFGPVEDPYWALIQSGQNVAAGRVNITIPDGNKLVVDANPSSMQIAEYTINGEFVADRYADSDFSTERFIYAPPGESTLSATNASGGKIRVVVELEKTAYAV